MSLLFLLRPDDSSGAGPVRFDSRRTRRAASYDAPRLAILTYTEEADDE